MTPEELRCTLKTAAAIDNRHVIIELIKILHHENIPVPSYLHHKFLEYNAYIINSTVDRQLFANIKDFETLKPLLIETPPYLFSPTHIDMELTSSITTLVKRRKLSVTDLVRIWRGETTQDSRPNKSLIIPVMQTELEGYANLSKLITIAKSGYSPHLKTNCQPTTQKRKNHGSADSKIRALISNVSIEQNKGRYIVLHDEILTLEGWENIIISPVGIVPKGNESPQLSGRTINDLSFGENAINSLTDQSHPNLHMPSYTPTRQLAKEALIRVSRARQQGTPPPKIMTGDVSGAFRNIPHVAEAVRLFAFVIPALHVVVLDLYLSFGWTESPRGYDIAGGAITHYHQMAASPAHPYYSHRWVDDHPTVECDINHRLDGNASALRKAMLVTLGSDAINEDKFTEWSHEVKVVGLIFDTIKGVVSLPEEKIEKVLNQIKQILQRGTANRKDLERLLGLLRHVGTCIRPALPFFQRLSGMLRLARQYRIPLSKGTIEDLNWLGAIFSNRRLLNCIPFEYFQSLPEPSQKIYMDASDYGLCCLNPLRKEYIRIIFNEDERQRVSNAKDNNDTYNINVREFQSGLLAASLWGNYWHKASGVATHIQFLIDNTSAVKWTTGLQSPNAEAQIATKCLAFYEALYNIHFSAVHLPGVENMIADAGSRPQDLDLSKKFTNCVSCWSQVEVPLKLRTIYGQWQKILEENPMPRAQD